MTTNPVELDEFTTAYIEAMLWAETADAGEGDRSFQDAGYTADSLASETMEKIKADCAKFQADHGPMIEPDLRQAGYDFLLTRQGHGTGFWDGNWPQADGEFLTEACKAYGEAFPYIGDDGLIYLQ